MVSKPKGWLLSLGLCAASLSIACNGGDSQLVGASPFLKAFEPDSEARVPGLLAPVDVVRDRWGIPHVFAQNDRDLSMAMGYLHAQDRLFLMDSLRLVAAGRLTEYLGQAALPVDLTMRRIMMTKNGVPVADAIFKQLDPELSDLLVAYSEGVNLYLQELRAGKWSLPPGYRTAAFNNFTADAIPDWRPSDTIAAGRLQELGLTSGSARSDLERGELITQLSPEQFADLTRFAPADPTVVIPEWFAKFRGLLSGEGNAERIAAPSYDRKSLQQALAAVSIAGDTPLARHLRGSNNWVIGGQHTQSGHAIVANDPHLDFTTPSTFYHAHLNTQMYGGKDGVNIIGVTTPGAPDVIIGHNQDVAWGATVVGWDVADAYVETLSEDGKSTLFNGQMVPIAQFPQTFRLGYAKDAPVHTEVFEYVPHHGPIFSKDMEKKTAITVKWTGRMPSLELSAFGKMSRSKNVKQFIDAVGGLTVLAQSWNAADRHGDLGYFPYAQVPVRASVTGACRPYLPMDGTGACEWVGTVPAHQVPKKMQGAGGWLVTANNDIPGQLVDNDPTNDSTYLHSDRSLGFRAGRITQVIQGWIRDQKKVTVQDVIGLQGDVHSLLAQRVVPQLLKAAEQAPQLVQSMGLADALGRLRAWDFKMVSGVGPTVSAQEVQGSVAASIFSVYLVKLIQHSLGDELEKAEVKVPGTWQIKTLLLLLESPQLLQHKALYWDRVDTPDRVETRPQILLESLKQSLDALASAQLFGNADPQSWRWGQIHQMEILDPLAMFLGKPLRSMGPFPRQGGNFTVDVASQRGVGTDFNFRSGPQMRFVAEMTPDGPVAVNALPGGQSDDPDSPHYDDLLKRWLNNETFPYYFKLTDILANKEHFMRWELARATPGASK